MTARTPMDLDAVAAPGTDPERLVRVLAWTLDPARGSAALRRAVAGQARLAPSDALPTHLDAVVAGPVDPLPAGVADAVSVWRRLGVRLATVVDPHYPPGCGQGWPDTDVPPWLAWRGQSPAILPAAAIVGARRATGYGTGVAAWLAETAARAGVRIVSGGALGVDAAAHIAALEQPGGTTVVLGCGHDVPYPRPHAGPGGLFDRVLDHGGSLVSELPPTAPTSPHHVRARNRIVASLADVVVVVEGGERSGSLLTATAAADRGIPVLAVPGDVRAPGSVAPHRLLAEGAGPCAGPPDLLDAVGRAASPDGAVAVATGVSVLPADVRDVLVAAWPRPVPVDELAARSGRPAAALLGSLTRARVAGETTDDAYGVRLRRAPA